MLLLITSCTLQQGYSRAYLKCTAVQEIAVAAAGVYVSGCGRDAWCENDRKRGWRCRDVIEPRARAERQVAIETACPPSQLLTADPGRGDGSFRIAGCGASFECTPGRGNAFACRQTPPRDTAL